MINGRAWAWESITVRLPSGVAVLIDSINYGDERDTRLVYGKGSRARAYSQGNYKGEGDMDLLREEFDRLNQRAGGQGMYGMTPFPIIVAYADEGKPTVVDTLQGVKIVKRGSGAQQNAEKLLVKVNFVVTEEILWGGRPAFIPR